MLPRQESKTHVRSACRSLGSVLWSMFAANTLPATRGCAGRSTSGDKELLRLTLSRSTATHMDAGRQTLLKNSDGPSESVETHKMEKFYPRDKNKLV